MEAVDAIRMTGDTKIECRRCEYGWEYSGDLPRATCPACGNKTPVESEESENSEEPVSEADA